MTARALDVGVEAGILAILLLSPIPLGSGLPWAQAMIEALVVFTAAMWIFRMVAAGQFAVRVSPLLWPGVAMLGLFGAQLLLPAGSVNPHATWESFRLFAAYFAFLVLLGAHLVTPGRIVRLVSALVAWGVVLAAWGLANHALGREVVVWFEKEFYRGRLVSTFVNANHQALYFAVPLFLAVGMLLRPSRRSPAPGAGAMSLPGTGLAARILFGGAAVVLGVALVLTASRGGVASVVAGVLTLGVLALVGRTRSRLLVGVAAGLGLFTGYVAWIGADRLLERLAVLAREPFADLRWDIWRATLRVAGDAPFLGTGLGTFEDAILVHRPTGLSDRVLLDYAHNDYLQLLAEGGAASVVILGWAAVVWLAFVVGRWRDRQDAFVRGLVMGGLGAVAAIAFHSTVDFGLHMAANGLLLVAVLALVPAVVTLRAHRMGQKVDLPEWRQDLGPRLRIALGVAVAVIVLAAEMILAPVAIAGWQHWHADRLLGEARHAGGVPTTADLAAAERALRGAARLEPWNPRIQAAWADVAAELGYRVWTLGLTPAGMRLRAGTARDRLVASQELLGVAYDAYGRSLRTRPRVALTHQRFGWFLARLEAIRRTVRAEGLRDTVARELAGTLGSDESLLPRALEHLQAAVRLEAASPGRRLGLVVFALDHREDVPEARTIAIREARETIQLDRTLMRDVVGLLTRGTVEPDLLWHAVPRRADTLVSLAAILEEQGRVSTASAALEDAAAIATTSSEKVSALLARSRFLLRHGSKAEALSGARQALGFAPRSAEVFAVLAEAYEANGLLAEAERAFGSALMTAGNGDPGKLKGYRDRLVSLLVRRGDEDGALALVRQAVQAIPHDPWVHLELAKRLELRGELGEALREYERARGLAPEDSDVQRLVAGGFLRNGLLREAAAAAEQAVRLNPGHHDLRVELGDLYSRMGLPERAGEQYRQVLARQPTHEAASRGLRAVAGVQKPG